MTRKDFELIAQSLAYAEPSRQVKPRGYTERYHAWRNTVLVMADYLTVTNPLFDQERFTKACGLKDAAYVNKEGETVNY